MHDDIRRLVDQICRRVGKCLGGRGESEEDPLERVSYWFIRSEFYRKGLAYLRLIYEATYILTYFHEFHWAKGRRISRLRGYHKYSKNLHSSDDNRKRRWSASVESNFLLPLKTIHFFFYRVAIQHSPSLFHEKKNYKFCRSRTRRGKIIEI